MSQSVHFVNLNPKRAADAPREKLSARVRRYFQTEKVSTAPSLAAPTLSDDLLIQTGPVGTAWVDRQDAG